MSGVGARLLTREEIARLRDRYTWPAFSQAWAELRDEARRALAQGAAIPAEGAGWWHDYFCPDHATQLEYDPARPHAHRCPVDGRIFSGEPYDGAWRYLTHMRLAQGAHATALRWLASAEAACLAHVRAVLLGYAARYAAYQPHGEHAGKGRVMGQSLDEAVWSIALSWAYDAVRDALAPDERRQIEEGLLRPAAAHLLGQRFRRVHNIECWHLAALASLGVVLADQACIAAALDEHAGFPAQLEGGVLADGWWWEGSPAYHFYALQALLIGALALRHVRPEMLAHARLRAMLDAPTELARADLSLPALNDCWFGVSARGELARRAALYETAWTLWRDPAHAALLARLYAAGEPRRSTEALLFGPEVLPAPAAVLPASRLFEASGYIVLRHGTGVPDERWLLLKFGPHGGGHGHPDKLSLDLHAFGKRLSPDLGTPGYGIPLNRTWYRHTLAHNTVLLDSLPQPPATGTLVRFAPPEQGDFAVADARVAWPAEAPEPYRGAAVRRCVLWKSPDEATGRPLYFIDLVQVRCPTPRQIDLAWHHTGALELPGLAPLGTPLSGEGYAHLTSIRQLRAAQWHAIWRLGDCGTQCFAADPPGATLLAAEAPYNPASERMPLLLRRVSAAQASFVAVYEPFQEQPAITRVIWVTRSLEDEGQVHFVVEGMGWRDAWVIYERERAQPIDLEPFRGAYIFEYVWDWLPGV
jgi:hypothetical protein